MVQRTSERLDLGQGRSPEVAIPGLGRVAPKNTAGIFDNQIATKYPDLTPVPDGRLDPVVAALFNVGSNITQALIQRQEQEAYLNGALAVGKGLTEEQIEANPLTRAWARAGYRDMVGRMSLAQYEADITKDLTKLREAPPEEMARYLQSKRQSIMPTLEKMSTEAKQQLFQQLLTTEQSAMAAHMKAHQEFIADSHQTAISSIVTLGIEKVLATDGPADPAYKSALAALGAKIDANIWQNPNLTKEMKVKLLEEATTMMLNQGDTGLYQLLRNGQVADEKGNPVSLWAQLPFATRSKLASAAHTASDKHTARVHTTFWNRDKAIKVALAAGEPVDMGVIYRHTREGEEIGTYTPNQSSSLLAQAARAAGEAQQQGAIIAAVGRGDTGWLAENGVGRDKAAKLYVGHAFGEARKQNLSAADAFRAVTTTAIETGFSELLAESGKMLSDQINALMFAQEGEIDANMTTVLTAWTEMVDSARMNNNPSALAASLSLLPEAQREFMLTYFAVRSRNSVTEGAVSGVDVSAQRNDTAVLLEARRLWREHQQAANDTTGTFQAMFEQTSKARAKAVSDLAAKGKLGSFGRAFLGLFSPTVRAQADLTKTNRWMLDKEEVANREYSVMNAIADEMANLARTRPGWTSDEMIEALADMAMINVANRTLNTDYGLVIMERGSNVLTTFNLPPAAGPEIAAKAINRIGETLGADPDQHTVEFTLDAGQLVFTVKTRDGATVDSKAVPNSDVGRVAQDILSGEDTMYIGAYGAGKEVAGNTGVKVRYNGANTAGIDNRLALKARDTLVEFENVRDTPYPDGKSSSGKQWYAVGVGINSINTKHYPKPEDFDENGKLKPDVLDRTFIAASDDAMNAAINAAQAYYLPTNDEDLFLLFTNLAYQGGVDFHKNRKGGYVKFLEHLSLGEEEEAVAALHNTNAYKAAGKARQKWYEAQVRKYLNK